MIRCTVAADKGVLAAASATTRQWIDVSQPLKELVALSTIRGTQTSHGYRGAHEICPGALNFGRS